MRSVPECRLESERGAASNDGTQQDANCFNDDFATNTRSCLAFR